MAKNSPETPLLSPKNSVSLPVYAAANALTCENWQHGLPAQIILARAGARDQLPIPDPVRVEYLWLNILWDNFYALPFASYIQRKLNLRVTSRIRRTRPPLRHYVITITSSRRPNGRLERPTAPFQLYGGPTQDGTWP